MTGIKYLLIVWIMKKITVYETKDGARFTDYSEAAIHELELMGVSASAARIEIRADFSRFGFKNPKEKYGGRLSVRAANVLCNLSIREVWELAEWHKTDFLKERNCGKSTLVEIDVLAETLGIEFGSLTIE